MYPVKPGTVTRSMTTFGLDLLTESPFEAKIDVA